MSEKEKQALEQEKQNKLAAINIDQKRRKESLMICGFCYFYKDTAKDGQGRCLKILNGIKNKSNVDFCGGARIVKHKEIHDCFNNHKVAQYE